MTESGYKTIAILLTECSFQRADVVEMSPSVKNHVEIKVDSNVSDNARQVSVKETLLFESSLNGETLISAKIAMVGVFEVIGTPELSTEDFGKVNAAAIIFPFIRENLASLTLKAGIAPVFLSPVNFTKRQ